MCVYFLYLLAEFEPLVLSGVFTLQYVSEGMQCNSKPHV